MSAIYKQGTLYMTGGGSSLPEGGTTGQVLTKKSNVSGDAEWQDVDGLPSGGTTGQALIKKSSSDGDADWEDINALPSGGTQGQVLKKKSNTSGDVEWANDEALPSGGTIGQFLKKNSSTLGDASWADLPTIQVSSMPTASAALTGKIYQFVGATSGGFINGYFYECVEDAGNPGTYLWFNKDVQLGGHQILDEGISLSARTGLNFTDFDLEDNSIADQTEVRAHALTSIEFNEIFSDKPNVAGYLPERGFTPIGTIITVLGVEIPQNYLECDGSVYAIRLYSDLADYIESQFGSKNYYGGDGITTFAVPDLTGNTLTDTKFCIAYKNIYLEEKHDDTPPEVYAFKIDTTVSDPALAVTPYQSEWGCDNLEFTPAHMNFTTDTFDYGSWTGNEFFFPKPCMLKYDGTVDYYLDPNDYTKKLDGTSSDVSNTAYAGNVMIEFPTIYFKRWTVGDINYCVISNQQLSSDFKAYAHHDVNGDVCEYIYISAYDGSYVGGKLRSISGIAANTSDSLTANRIMNYTIRQQEIDFAKANNVRNDCEGWNVWHKAERDMVNDLLILIGMNLNTQAIFGRGRDTGGSSYSSTGIVATGSMNTKGLFWGENAGAAGVKVFGIENWWGNIWKNLIGYINDNGTQKVKMTYGPEDGSNSFDYNLTGSGYISISGATPAGTSGGYTNKWQFSRNGLVPYQASGGDSTYLCDGLYFNNLQVDCAIVGGSSGAPLQCGAFCANLNVAVSDAYWNGGAALSYKSLAGGNGEASS